MHEICQGKFFKVVEDLIKFLGRLISFVRVTTNKVNLGKREKFRHHTLK